MDTDLALLEQKLAALIAQARALRSENAALNRELVLTRQENRTLTQRMDQASARLDALMERLPER